MSLAGLPSFPATRLGQLPFISLEIGVFEFVWSLGFRISSDASTITAGLFGIGRLEDPGYQDDRLNSMAVVLVPGVKTRAGASPAEAQAGPQNAYDGASRLTNVSDGTCAAADSFLANAPLGSEAVCRQGVTVRMTTYDGNGNVIGLVKATDVTVSARYEYDRFGQTVRASGTAVAAANPYRFSTEYDDHESHFLYYGHRFYNPNTGRWINRDPVGEMGGNNLLLFVGNRALILTDAVGLEITEKQCKDKVEELKKGDPVVLRIFQLFKDHRPNPCPIPEIVCECCTGGGTTRSAKNEAIVCYGNKEATLDWVVVNTRHELTHLLDMCYGANFNDCDARACSEIRGATYSGQCDDGGINRLPNQTKEDCVKDAAARATSVDKKCGDGKDAVTRVFKRCYPGSEPPAPIPAVSGAP